MAFRTTELSDGWQIRPDPHERGRKDGWGISPPESGWVAAKMPAAFQSQFGLSAPPVCWYRRSLTAEECQRESAVGRGSSAGSRVWLRFESVATDVTLWVNGREVGEKGRHLGDWVPFQFDLTDYLHTDSRPNDIVLRVDRVAPQKEVWVDGAPVWSGHLTKGFHDILSVHKGGIWRPVHLEVTGDLVLVPDGLGITADLRTGRVQVDVELERNVGGGWIELEIHGPPGGQTGDRMTSTRVEIKDGADSVHLQLDVPNPEPWHPEHPSLYRVNARLISANGEISQREFVRFGFRRAEVGGKDGRQILLNGKPIFLSGVLDWGHEPHHISPAATPDEIRARFATLRSMGFNLVCLCMWYPPRYFFDIADETGMLLWQEHPVWKPPMGDEHIPEYQRQFTKFFRRDRNHPSVVMVSGSCEHERFNPKLATWWWGRVRALMPDRIAQIQTAFFAWTDQTKTDAYDEHTYDSCGRWTRYLEDLQNDLHELPPRPFVMGESILYTNWPDTKSLLAATDPITGTGANTGRPWWLPLGLDASVKFEAEVIERFGQPVLDAFKRRAHRYHLEGRKFQFELYRQYPNHAGLVMNHVNDVPACRCGFRDELDRWYFTPEQTRPWLCDAPLVLRTDNHLRGLTGGSSAEVAIGISNFSPRSIDAPLAMTSKGAQATLLDNDRLAAQPGEVTWRRLRLSLPSVTSPQRVELRASAPGLVGNSWTLWNLPSPAKPPRGVVRLSGLPFDAADRELEFEDKAYSSGWGSPVRSWTPLLPDPESLAPELPACSGGGRLPEGTHAVLTHRLTPSLVDFLTAGGRIVLLVSRTAGSAPVKYVNLWGQLPLILERGPLGPGDGDWVGDLLDHDLSRRSVRAIPVGELGLDHALEPIIRLVYCHDIVDRPRLMDFISTARVGKGLLVLSGVDHSTPAGRYMLDRLLAFAASDHADTSGRLDESIVRSWAVKP
jgi:hypothetical protein